MNTRLISSYPPSFQVESGSLTPVQVEPAALWHPLDSAALTGDAEIWEELEPHLGPEKLLILISPFCLFVFHVLRPAFSLCTSLAPFHLKELAAIDMNGFAPSLHP